MAKRMTREEWWTHFWTWLISIPMPWNGCHIYLVNFRDGVLECAVCGNLQLAPGLEPDDEALENE